MSFFEREELKNLLGSTVAVVTFKKTNGETRVMRCTRDIKIIPVQDKSKEVANSYKIREYVSQLCSVWDLDKAEWGSFLFDNVLYVIQESMTQP